MAVEMVTIHNHAVFRDDAHTWRWYDAIGPNVVKYIQQFEAVPTDDSTGMPTEFTYTVVGDAGDNTFAITDVAGGAALFTTDSDNNDGIKLQLGDENSGAGENVDFSGDYPTYFGTCFKLNDVDATDVLVGFCVTDTACLDAVSDGMYFRSIDGTDDLDFVLEKDNDESTTSVADITDDTYITLEAFYFDHEVKVYADNTLISTISDSDTNFPDDELLRLTIELLTGDDSANTMTMKWLRFIQIRA